MQSLCLSVSSLQLQHYLLPNHQNNTGNIRPIRACTSTSTSTSTTLFNPLRLSTNQKKWMISKKRSGMRSSGGGGAVCYISTSSSTALLSPPNLQWVSTVSAVILMLVKGTAINRSFLVPFFALQAPASVMSWMQGEYGAWSALLALLVRLFFFIPGELELPFMTLVLVLVAPREAMNFRGTQTGALISLVIGAYLAFQQFTRVGMQKSFDQASIVPTLAIICTAIVPCLLLIRF
ncbi:cold-regulated 413 inner membrane protein 2, chloroplastic-like [Silene latifolia]|uniref:cold-regulated 413 inner membrane protein 2, chloroplastic-like n=1 Tax=Silene latifolia TaxID=37657 RepID=UPI003D7810AD